MPISEKQLHANRQNARLTRGPVTPEGKKRSSQNARRHGITAQTTVMTEEDRLKHDSFCARMMAELAPVGEMETFFASSVAEDSWRLNHCRAQTNNIASLGHFDGVGDNYETQHVEIQTALTTAAVYRDNPKTFELLSLYEQRIHRALQKHMADLKKLQAERQAKRAADLEDARLLSQLAKLKNLPYIPVQDGFVFSNAEIDRYTELFHRRNLAHREDFTYREKNNLLDLPKIPTLPKAA